MGEYKKTKSKTLETQSKSGTCEESELYREVDESRGDETEAVGGGGRQEVDGVFVIHH